jgi:hypothetical protein
MHTVLLHSLNSQTTYKFYVPDGVSHRAVNGIGVLRPHLQEIILEVAMIKLLSVAHLGQDSKSRASEQTARCPSRLCQFGYAVVLHLHPVIRT